MISALRPMYFIALAILVLILPRHPAFGQTPGTGAIAGVVYDPASRVVSNAEVLAVNVETHATRSVSTTGEGIFHVPLLLPGSYIVTVKAPGFAVKTSHAIEVTASQTTSLGVTLAIAEANTSVEVGGHAQLADMEGSTLGGLVDEKAIQTLPLSNRNYTQILGLSPGVVSDIATPAVLGNGTQNVASNGATPTSNNIQFNGVDANNLAENSAAESETSEVGTAIPAPDAIQEFRVQTANFDAAYGRGTGANVDLVSKTGTNQFHGSAWEFLRNNILNANDFFSKQAGQPRADLKQNQFGAAFGGPVVHDKTFFFVAYEGLTDANGLGDEETTALPLLTQDRSAATLGAQFCPAGHLDAAGQPATGYLTQAGGTQVACDGSNISPIALAVLNAKLPNGQFAVPSPQVTLPVSGIDPTDQFPLGESTFTIPAHYRSNQFSVNVDQVLNPKNTLSGRFFFSRATTALAFTPTAASVPGWGTNELSRNTMFVLADTHVFNSNLVNVARFGYIRFDGTSSVVNPILAQAIGIDTPTGLAGPASNAPGISVGNGFTTGDAGTPSQWQVTNSFIYQDTIAMSKGRHNARFGVEYKRHEVDENMPFEADGLVSFGTLGDFLLGETAAQNGSPTGLSNVESAFAGGGISRRNFRYNDLALFAQDDIKLAQHLTMNAGLRYEIFSAPVDTNGRLANFDPALAPQGPVPASGTFLGYTVPSNFTGSFPSGVAQTPYKGYWQTPYGDVSPRLGFVWQVTDKPVVVVRGGYGIYFDEHANNVGEQAIDSLPFVTFQFEELAQESTGSLQHPFVPLVLPSSSYPVFMPRTPDSAQFIESVNPHLKDGMTQEYNLNVQYAIGRGYLLELGYVGTWSTNRPGQVEFDQALLASPANPINGQTTNSVANEITRQPWQGIAPGGLYSDSNLFANYNSLQTSITHEMQHGFQLKGSYTWSKNLDEVNAEGGGQSGIDTFELQLPTNNQLDPRHSSYGLAGDDRDQRAVVNFIWSAPKFGSIPILARHVIANWEFSGIGVVQSGQALSVFDSNAGSVYGLLSSQTRAESVAGVNPSTGGSLFSRVTGNGGYLNANAFTRAPEAPNGTTLADQDFGNSPVGLVRGPGQHNLDMAVERIISVKETNKLLFRAEVFNLTNTPQFANPSASLGYSDPTLANPVPSSSFGRIFAEQGGPHPRIIQFAAKYTF